MPRNSKVRKKVPSKPRPVDGKGRLRRGRPKVCLFCAEQVAWVDYKDLSVLRRFTNDRGRIKARGATGTCAQHQRDVAVAIKTARELALLPYAVRTLATDSQRQHGGSRRGAPSGPPSAESAEDADQTPAPDAISASDGVETELSEPDEVSDEPNELVSP
jgi:small subunit ribosomal protein S18